MQPAAAVDLRRVHRLRVAWRTAETQVVIYADLVIEGDARMQGYCRVVGPREVASQVFRPVAAAIDELAFESSDGLLILSTRGVRNCFAMGVFDIGPDRQRYATFTAPAPPQESFTFPLPAYLLLPRYLTFSNDGEDSQSQGSSVEQREDDASEEEQSVEETGNVLPLYHLETTTGKTYVIITERPIVTRSVSLLHIGGALDLAGVDITTRQRLVTFIQANKKAATANWQFALRRTTGQLVFRSFISASLLEALLKLEG